MPEHHQTQITLNSNIVTDSCLQRLPVQCWLQYYDYNVPKGHLTNRQSIPYGITGLNVMLTFQKETSHQKPFTERDIWELYRKIAVWLTLENIVISQNYLLQLSHANYKLKTSNFQRVSNYTEYMAKVLWCSKVLKSIAVEFAEALQYVITCSIHIVLMEWLLASSVSIHYLDKECSPPGIRKWISNYKTGFMWDVIDNPCSNLNRGLVKLLPELGCRWLITLPCFMWR